MENIHPISCGLGIGFLIETTGGLFLIDSGSPGHEQKVLSKIRELGRSDLKLIWITHAHYDHYGSAAALRRITGAIIGVHPADAANLTAGLSPLGTSRRHGFLLQFALGVLKQFQPIPQTQPDITIDDGSSLENYGLNATIMHTPGHTPGHTCIQLAGGIIFAGDLIGKFVNARRQQFLATNWSQLSNSLEKLKAAKPEWIYTGHSKIPISGESLLRI
jgi:glyoxylase-like metal-dependent hydrolase (beta-lactamase superfamily II)